MMRRSAGMGGGGGVMKAVGRIVGAGVKETLSSASRPKRRAVTVSTSASSSASAPSSPTFAAAASAARVGGWDLFPYFCDGDEWEEVGAEAAAEDEDEEFVEEGLGYSERFVFGRAPSREEAEEAVSTLQQIFLPVTFSQVTEDGSSSDNAVDKEVIAADKVQRDFATETESDWIEPALHLYSSQAIQSQDRERVLDAFRLLQINPSIQKMVVSLSSDKDVWNAVMKNEVVQELKKTFVEGDKKKPQSPEEQPDVATKIIKWILNNTKAKVVEFFDMITKLVNEVFNMQEKNKDCFDVAVRSSFMLSIVVFIIVVVTRIQKS